MAEASHLVQGVVGGEGESERGGKGRQKKERKEGKRSKPKLKVSLAQALERDDPEADEAAEAASFDATTLVRRPFGGVVFGFQSQCFLDGRRGGADCLRSTRVERHTTQNTPLSALGARRTETAGRKI